MDSNIQWYFNPYDQVQPLRQNENPQQYQPIPVVSQPPSNRVCEDIPYPIVHKLLLNDLFDFGYEGAPNIDRLVYHLNNEGFNQIIQTQYKTF
ncbi:unnamed protein product, partial [Rotaria sp. Silwood1]